MGDKFTICPTLEIAELNLIQIHNLMSADSFIDYPKELWDVPKKLGNNLKENIWETSRYYYITPPEKYRIPLLQSQMTDNDPGLETIHNFYVYDYLTETAHSKFPDPSLPPYSIDYVIDVNRRFHKIQKFEFGFLIETQLHEWDNVNRNSLQEVVKIDEQYFVLDDSSYESTKSVDYRIKTRQWMSKTDIYVPGKEKITYKYYDTFQKRNEEGRRRRNNIITNLKKEYILLRMFQLGETQSQAEIEGFTFLKNYTSLINDFVAGSWEIIPTVQADTDVFLNTTMTDPAIPSAGGAPFSVVYPLQLPELVNNSISAYIGQSIKERILDILKGLV